MTLKKLPDAGDWLTKNLRDVFLLVMLGIQGFTLVNLIIVRESQIQMLADSEADRGRVTQIEAAIVNINSNRYTYQHAEKDKEINELKRELLKRDIDELKNRRGL
jgi:hypothetical protein